MIKYKKSKSFNVQIWIGLKSGYYGEEFAINSVYDLCRKYVNEKKYCLTVTETKFLYFKGEEHGIAIGLINYPRFPINKKKILKHAFNIGEMLLKELKQYRISITTPDKTYMIENKDY